MRPACEWFAHPFVPVPGYGLVCPVLSSRARARRRNHQVPRVPLPDVGITVIREPCHRLFRGHYSPFLAPTDSFANPGWLSFPSVFRLVAGVFAGCYQPRLRTRIFPTLFLRICPVLPEPVPRRVPWSAFAWFFLHVFGLPKKENWSASRLFPRTRFSAGLLSRLQLFRYVQASQFACLPDRSYRCKLKLTGQPRLFYVRAERASLPSHASDMLSARLQAIGGTRTFTSQDSQLCRLLTPLPSFSEREGLNPHGLLPCYLRFAPTSRPVNGKTHY